MVVNFLPTPVVAGQFHIRIQTNDCSELLWKGGGMKSEIFRDLANILAGASILPQ